MANVFYLDVDDEITSAAARIRASKDPRVGLVVPPGSRIATSRINFRLLAREALERNRALSIVSSDPAARALAASAGLPAFATVADFEADQGSTVVAPAGAGAAAVAAAVTAGVATKSTTGAPAGRPGSSAAARHPDGPPPPQAPVLADGRIGARSSGASAPTVRPAGRTVRSPVRAAAGGVAVLVMILVLGLIGVFFLPSATITVTPRVEAVTPIELSIRADPNATASDPVAGVVPATVLTMDFTSSGTFNATGKKTTTTTATGSVTFTSINTLSSVTFPAGSIVSTSSGVQFATTSDLTLPRWHGRGPMPSGSVEVKAVKGGTSGNVQTGAIDQLPPGYQSFVYTVTNPAPTSGGTSTTTTQIQKSDTDAAMAGLTKDLKSQFTAWLAAPTGLASGSTAFPKTGLLGVITPDNDPTTLIGMVQPTFELTLTASGTVTAVDQSAVTTLATTRLQTTVTSDYSLVAGSTKVTIGTPRADSDAVVFPVTATASQVRHLDPDTLRGLVAGKSVDEARAILATYGTVEIQTWPGFVNTVPSLAWRLSLTVDGGAPGASTGPSTAPLETAPASSGPSAVPSVGPSSLILARSRAA
ncbi:MAG TPA: baseplate J/gp47 family protein [Candidatus Limnocylindrales bacterium]|nr:baseplate J/gp47 family protein [Candidatus Limnocylindrales bacterium]